MLSGSHPFSKLLIETNIVTGSIITVEINPANTLINTKSTILILSKLKRIQIILAIIAKNKDKINVKIKEDIIFSVNTLDFLKSGSKIPICKLELSLDPKEPKIFPLIPIAPGIITSNPGNASRKNVILPRTKPANKSPKAQIKRAISPSLILRLFSP